MSQSDGDENGPIPSFSPLFYCAEGVKNDFQKVVDRFLSNDSVRYEDFLTIWHDMHFYHIFRGRESKSKLKEFAEECLKLACELWIESADFQVQVCGLYLLYGLYSCQPIEPKSRIRMTLPMWETVQEFIKSVKQYKHFDVQYIYMKLVLDKAFHYVATLSNENSLATNDYRRQKMLDKQEHPNKQTPTLIQNLMEPDNFLKLEVIDQQYQQMKRNLCGESSTPDQSLSMIHPDLPETMSKEVTHFKERRLGAINAPVVGAPVERSLQAQIKHKAQERRAPPRVRRGVPKLERKSRYKDSVNENDVSLAVMAALNVKPSRFDSMPTEVSVEDGGSSNGNEVVEKIESDSLVIDEEFSKGPRSSQALGKSLFKSKRTRSPSPRAKKSPKAPKKAKTSENGIVNGKQLQKSPVNGADSGKLGSQKTDKSIENGHGEAGKKKGPPSKKNKVLNEKLADSRETTEIGVKSAKSSKGKSLVKGTAVKKTSRKSS